MRTKHTQVSGNKSTRQMLHHPVFLHSADTHKDKPKENRKASGIKVYIHSKRFLVK